MVSRNWYPWYQEIWYERYISNEVNSSLKIFHINVMRKRFFVYISWMTNLALYVSIKLSALLLKDPFTSCRFTTKLVKIQVNYRFHFAFDSFFPDKYSHTINIPLAYHALI